MLVIYVQTEAMMVIFRLEGRLSGAGVRELARHWSSAVFKQPDQRMIFDLSGVTSVDDAGREFLARVHEYGDLLIGVGGGVGGIDDLSEAPRRADAGAEHQVRIIGDEASRDAEFRSNGELTGDSQEDHQPAGEAAGDHATPGVLVG